jgi:hypothetical protein
MEMHISGIAALIFIGASTVANASNTVGCNTAQSHQFDFWVGTWNVFPNVKGAQQVATSLIESLYSGCGIRENWMPLNGSNGGSMNAYSQVTGQWEQFWVDSGGSAVHFSGGLNGKSMVIQGLWPAPGHANQLSRITYTPLKKGRVEQLGEISNDGGANWSKSFDFIYKPAK